MKMRKKGFISMLAVMLTTMVALPVGTSATPTFKTILATGPDYSLYLKPDATLWGWGSDNFGELGNGLASGGSSAVQNSLVQDYIDIAAGQGHHSLGLRDDGKVFAWGVNFDGQLGDGSTYINRNDPIQVSGLSNVIDVEVGSDHSLALKSDGTVWGWGSNYYSQLGDGTTTTRLTPVQVSGLTNIVAIASNSLHNLAIKSDGTVWAWGENTSGQLGDGTTTTPTTPVQVSGLSNVSDVTTGISYSLAVKTDGTVWAWGDNAYGQLGDGTTTSRTTPVQITGLSNVKEVKASWLHSLAVKNDGTLWAWGFNYYGQLGNGTTGTTYHSPIQITGISGVTTISTSSSFSAAVKSNGTVWAWGRNLYGNLGDGTTTDSSSPVQVTGL